MKRKRMKREPDADQPDMRFERRASRDDVMPPPGGSDMTMSEAFTVVLGLAERQLSPSHPNRERDAYNLVRALAVGSFSLGKKVKE